MQNAQNSAILSSFIKLHIPVVIKTFVFSILSGRFTVLLNTIKGRVLSIILCKIYFKNQFYDLV